MQRMTTHPYTTWLLVAHRAGALLFESRKRGTDLTRVDQIENPRGRLKAGEVDSDRPGRAFDKQGGGRHAYSKEESPTEHVEHELVKELVGRLEKARTAGEFARLILIAPAKMLGQLRDELSDPLRAMVVASVAKNFAHTDDQEMHKHIAALGLP
jgi:protein required for attachment to host cells